MCKNTRTARLDDNNKDTHQCKIIDDKYERSFQHSKQKFERQKLLPRFIISCVTRAIYVSYIFALVLNYSTYQPLWLIYFIALELKHV